MFSTEHLKTRVSDTYQGGRALVPRDTVKCGDGRASYGMGTLQGNWNEERFDSKYVPPQPVIKTDLEHVWQTSTKVQTATVAPPPLHKATSQQLYQRAMELAPPPAVPGAPPPGTLKKTMQSAMVDIVDARHRAYPGHQPESDLHKSRSGSSGGGAAAFGLTTEVRQSFLPPVERQRTLQINAADLYSGPAHDKVQYTVFKIRMLLDQRNAAPTTSTVFASRVRGPTKASMEPKAVEQYVKSHFSYAALRRALRAVEGKPLLPGVAKGDGFISLAELAEGLRSYNVELDPDELLALHKAQDTENRGEISIDALVGKVRGSLSIRRAGVVRRAYDLLSKLVHKRTGVDIVRFRDVLDNFDAAAHPSVLMGQATQEEVCRSLFDDYFAIPDMEVQRQRLDQVFPVEAFLEMYADWSALVAADYFFEHAVRNAWHVAGGEGAAQNTSCRKVTVVHTNGRVTQQTIIDDLGIEASDDAAMRENLFAQGIRDVKRIQL